MSYRIILLLMIVPMLVACGGNGQSSVPVVPEFSDQRLVEGRAIWMNTCRNCHLMGVAGAPAINDVAAWAPRREKAVDALYSSALQGIGKGDAWAMPPRGGNDALSDEQVRLAVDFMLAAVESQDDK